MFDRPLRNTEDDMGVQTMAIRCEGCASCDGVLWRRRACSCAHLWCCEESTLLVGVILCVFSEWTVGAVFIRNACCRLRCGAHAIVAVRASLTKRKVSLDPSALSGCEGEAWILRVLSLRRWIRECVVSCREGVCDAAHEVLVSLVEAACGLWEGGVFVGFQSLQSVTVDSIHRRRVTNILSIGINTLPLDNHCFHSNRRREG